MAAMAANYVKQLSVASLFRFHLGMFADLPVRKRGPAPPPQAATRLGSVRESRGCQKELQGHIKNVKSKELFK